MFRAILSIALTWGLFGCDPCAGVIGCTTAPFAAMEGQMVTPPLGYAAAGVRIEVIRTGSVPETLRTTANAEGFWRVEFASVAASGIDVDVLVTPLTGAPYSVSGVHLDAHTRRGEATVMPHWLLQPYFPDVAELFVKGPPEKRIANASVEFRRTAGIDMYGPGVMDGVVHEASDAAGRVPLLSRDRSGVYSTSVGYVVGTLTIRASLSDSIVIRGFRVRSTPVFDLPPGVFRIDLNQDPDSIAAASQLKHVVRRSR